MNHLYDYLQNLAISSLCCLCVFTSTGFAEEKLWQITGPGSAQCNGIVIAGSELFDLGGEDPAYPAIGRSTNGGQTWTLIRSAPRGAFKAAAGSHDGPPVLFFLTDMGLFRFDRNTSGWIETGPTGNRMTIDPNRSGRVFLEMDEVTIESTDSGESWHPFERMNAVIDHVCFAYAHPDAMVWYDREKDDIFFTPGNGQIRRLGNPSHQSQDFVLHLTSDLTIYLSNEEQFYRYDLDDTAWIELNRMPSDIMKIESASGCVAVCLSGMDIRYSRNRGLSWTTIPDITGPADLEVMTGGMYLAAESGLYVTRDSFSTIERIENRTGMKHFLRLIVDSRAPHDMYASGNRVCRSVDAGETWQPLEGLPGEGCGVLLQSSFDPEIWCFNGDSIYYSDDDMQTWIDVGWDYPDVHYPNLIGIRADRGIVCMSNGSYNTGDGMESITYFYVYDHSQFEWANAGYQLWSTIRSADGDATEAIPYIYSGGFPNERCYLSSDMMQTVISSPTEIKTFQVFPIRNDQEEILLNGIDRLLRYDMITGETIPLEKNLPISVTFLSPDEYMLSDYGILRSDKNHLAGIPVGDLSVSIQRVYWFPEFPLRVFCLPSFGGVAYFDLNPETPPPPPPQNIAVNWVSEHEIDVDWTPSIEASGTRIYCFPDDAGTPEIFTLHESTGHARIHTESFDAHTLTTSIQVSEFDSQGKESGLSTAVTSRVGRQAPRIMMTGCWNSRIESQTGGLLRVASYVTDRQGIETIRSVELYVEGLPTGQMLRDDGIYPDGSAGDGLFFIEIPVSSGIHFNPLKIEIVATDQDGFIGRPPATIPVSQE